MSNIQLRGRSSQIPATALMQSVSTSPPLPAFPKQTYLLDCSEQDLSDVKSVDLAISLMDKQHKTSFYEWIRNENNSDYIAIHLKRVIGDYSMVQQVRALNWLFFHGTPAQQWEFRSVATLLIKLFYEKGLDQPEFGQLIGELLVGKEWKFIEGLVVALIIGEDEKIVSKFLYHVTRTWDPETATDLVMAVAARSHWKSEYLQNVIVYFSGTSASDDIKALEGESAKARMLAIQKKFMTRTESMITMKPEEFASKYQVTFKHFARETLLNILQENYNMPKRSRRMEKKSTGTSPSRIKLDSTAISPLSLLSSPVSMSPKSAIFSQNPTSPFA